MLSHILCIFLLLQLLSTKLLNTEDREYFELSVWENIETSLNLGEIKGFYSISEYNDLMKSYAQNFPEVVRIVTIGQTLEGNDIYALHIATSADSRLLTES
mmetsp:Transcript_16699/g.14580  ORF Transcript_16699/g.14580 Transcript_16699/m.14580 type:complete len:101 (+) Transcript_16699:51-353(+)